MEKIKSKISEIYNSEIYRKITGIAFPVILAIYALIKINKGLEITDTAYNYTNFRFTDKLDSMWLASTFLANMTGHLFTLLPFGRTMLGLNFYTCLFKLGCILLAYFFFVKKVKLPKELVFIGELAAAGLCWCPTAVLYNYMTYFLVTLTIVLLYSALTGSEDKKNIKFLIAAGFTLGTNLFVRLPNLCEAALIVAVWYAGVIKKDSVKKIVRDTFLCIGGYLGAFVVWLIYAMATMGAEFYFKGIGEMFGGGGATQYGSAYMLLFTAFSGYIGIWYWLEITILVMLFILLASLIIPDNSILVPLRYVIAPVTAIVLIYWYYRTAMFTRIFYEYSSMYGINVIALVFAILFLGVIVFRKDRDINERILCALVLIIIPITPLGSNNGMYSTLNNLFLVYPIMLNALIRRKKNVCHVWPVQLAMGIIVSVAIIHAVAFGSTFVFRDGGGQALTASVEGNDIVKGMKTIPSNARYITEATKVWKEGGHTEDTVLVFGNAAGLCFYLDSAPAISTAWPSLASFSYDKYVGQMRTMEAMHNDKGQKLPVIILGQDAIDVLTCIENGDEIPEAFSLDESYVKKIDILRNFLIDYNYDEIYACDTFAMLSPN